MADLIDRKDAIGAILSVRHIAELSDGDAVIRVSAVNYVLRNLPSAQPKRIKAKWWHYEGMYTCENCNATLDDESPFCPMCGADMREEKT